MNSESMLKGRMAETLFEEMLRQSGNIVYRFGYEAIVQNLTQLEEKFDRFSDVGERVRSIPDFIVIDKKGKPEFVEVKFRWKSEIHSADVGKFKKIEKFWNAKIVVVSCWKQPYFRVMTPPYFSRGEAIYKPLESEVNWQINNKIYKEYEELVHKYLTPTLVPSRK